MPPDLFRQSLDISPPSHLEGPRFWIRRLVIWKSPGEIIRDIRLRPGLNIVWTPDENGIGHGGGKTLFCRLLRYCLGEDRFAPEEQRERISSTFIDGLVGAEVVLDRVVWAIARPLGNRRRHFAVPASDLESLFSDDVTSTGIEPFLDAVEKSILTEELASLVPGHRQDNRAWPIALAWLTRDQECRFDHVLDWRSTESDSESPARGLNQTEKLEAVRAFLQGITLEEKNLNAEIADLNSRRAEKDQEIGHRKWEVTRSKKRLTAGLGVSDDGINQGDMLVSMLRSAAEERLAGIAGLPRDGSATEIARVREEYLDARDQLTALEKEHNRLEAKVSIAERTIGLLKGELPPLSYAIFEAQSVPCPICSVPIDRVLAEGCKLSDRIPDLKACEQRLRKKQAELDEEQKNHKSLQDQLTSLKPEIALAKQVAERKEQYLRSLEAATSQQHQQWYTAQRAVDDVEDLAKLVDQQNRAIEDLEGILSLIEGKRGHVSMLQEQQARVFSDLAEKFDPIVRRLIGEEASGEVRLTGKGLGLTVKMGGDRSTSAIDSLKIVAFDLAVLCLSMEGKTRLPSFLVHDSPREADMGLPLYEQIFNFAHELESIGKGPLFQYIVTTTTRPPPNLSDEPWVRLKLAGTPAADRLLKCDL